jgi:hypothetical protein
MVIILGNKEKLHDQSKDSAKGAIVILRRRLLIYITRKKTEFKTVNLNLEDQPLYIEFDITPLNETMSSRRVKPNVHRSLAQGFGVLGNLIMTCEILQGTSFLGNPPFA